MDREQLTPDQQAERLWQSWGNDAFAVVQRSIATAHDRVFLDEARYWLDVETRLYTRSLGLRAA